MMMTKTQEDAIRNLTETGGWYNGTKVSYDMIYLSNEMVEAKVSIQELIELAAKGLEPAELTEAQRIAREIAEFVAEHVNSLYTTGHISATIHKAAHHYRELTKPAPTLAERAAEWRKAVQDHEKGAPLMMGGLDDFLLDVIAAEQTKIETD